MAIAPGDFIEIQYTGRTKDGRVFDTTLLEEAKKAGLPDDASKYGDVLLVAGKGQVVKGLDDAILKAEAGKPSRVELTKPFGERRDDLVGLVPLSKMREQGVDPVPGLFVELEMNGRPARARVQSVNGGRVRVDLNHELAGEDASYDFTVTHVFTQPADKLTVLMKHVIPELAAGAVQLNGDTAEVRVGAAWKKDADYIVAKLRFVEQALLYIPQVKKVVVHEEYAAEEPGKA